MLWGQHVGGLGEKTVIFAGVMTYVLGRQGDNRWSRGAAVLIGARGWISGVSVSNWCVELKDVCELVILFLHFIFCTLEIFFKKSWRDRNRLFLLKSVNLFTRWITLYHSLWVFSSPRNLCLHVHNHQVQTSKSRLMLTREVRDPDHRYGAHPHFSGARSIQSQLPLQQSMLIGFPSQCVTVLWAAPASYYSNHKNISWV